VERFRNVIAGERLAKFNDFNLLFQERHISGV
jgi:hypothetical protein